MKNTFNAITDIFTILRRHKITLCILLSFALFGFNLNANTTKVYKWNGSAGDKDWSNKANWTLYTHTGSGANDWTSANLQASDSLPGEDDDVVIETTSGNVEINFSEDIKIHGLITFGPNTCTIKNSSASSNDFTTNVLFIGKSGHWYRNGDPYNFYVGEGNNSAIAETSDMHGTLCFSGNSTVNINYLDSSSWVANYGNGDKNTLKLDSSVKVIINTLWSAGTNPQPDNGTYVARTGLDIESGSKLILFGVIDGADNNKTYLNGIIDASKTAGNTEDSSTTKTFTWKGGAAGKTQDWNEASNWVNNSVPSTDSEIIIKNATNYPKLSSNTTIAKLNIASNATLDLNNFDITISDEYKNAGSVITNGSETVSLPSTTNETGTWIYKAGNVSNITNLNFKSLQIDGTTVTQNGQLNCSNLIVTTDSKFVLKNYSTNLGSITNNGILDFNSQNYTLTSYSGSGEIQINGGTLASAASTEITINKLTPGTTESTLDGSSNGILISTINGTTGKLKTNGTISLEGQLDSLELDSCSLTLTDNSIIGTLTIGSSSTLTASNTFTADSVSISASGNLSGASGKTITIGGNWTNNNGAAGFTANGGTVIFTNNATISGNTSFYNLSCTTGGTVLSFSAGSKQTVANSLTINGSTSSPITLQSNTSGSTWEIDVAIAKATVSNAKIKDSVSTNDSISATSSISLGNNTNWKIPGTYKWNSTTTTNWQTASNWQIKELDGTYSTAASYPQFSDDDVTISSTSKNPILPSDLSLKKITVEAGATLDLVNFSLTVPTIINNGTIKLYGTQNIKNSTGGNVTLTNGTNSTINYYGSQTVTSFFTTNFENLTIDSGSILQLGTNTLSVSNVNNSGTIKINSSGKITISNSLSNAGTVELSSTGTINKMDNTQGLFIYNGYSTLLDFGATDYYNLQVSENCSSPASEINIAGTLTIDANKTLSLRGNIVADTLTNNGSIICSNKNLSFTSVSGTINKITATTGNITLQSTGSATTISDLTLQGGSLINNSSNLLTVTSLNLSTVQTTLQAGTGGISISNALSSGNLSTSGTVTLSGTLAGLSVTQDTTSASGDLTITGTNPFLTVDGTLDMSGYDLMLTGTSASNKVTVTGSGSITLSNNQINGDYISINTSSCPAINGGKIYTAIHSSTATSTPENGWNILSGDLAYVWNGKSAATPTSLSTNDNWNTNQAPSATDNIQLPAGCTNYPVLSSDTVFADVTIEANAVLDFAGYNLTTDTFTNNGKIRLSGTNTIIASAKSYGNANTIEYYGSSPNAVTGSGAPETTDYKNLSIDTDTELSLNSSSITIGKILSNEGSININGTGIFNIAATGTADPDSGSIEYSSTTATTKTIPNIGFYNLKISGGDWSDTSSAGLSLFNNFDITGGSFTCNGNLTVSNILTVDTASNVKFNNGTGSQTTTAATATFTNGTIYFGNNENDSFSVTGNGNYLVLSGNSTYNTAGTLSGKAGINLGKNLTVDANTTCSDAVTLSGNSTISNGTNTVTFNSTINGAHNLSTLGTGTIIFNDSLGSITNLASISIAGNSNINCANIQTSGTQTYSYISLSQDSEFTSSGTITLNGKIAGSTNNLTLSGDTDCYASSITAGKLTNSTGKQFTIFAPLTLSGNFENRGTISVTNSLNSLSITGNLENTGTVDSASTISLTGDLTDTTGTWTNGSIIFNGTTDQDFNPNTTTSYSSVSFENTGTNKTVTIKDSVTITNLSNPTGKNSNINFSKGGAITNAADFNTTGTITLGSDNETSTFQGGISHTAGKTIINGTVATSDKNISFAQLESSDGKSIELNSGSGNITLTGTVSTTSLTATSGSININTASLTTTGNQTFDGTVNIGNQVTTFEGNTIHFKKAITGQNNIIIKGKADFDDTVSGFANLSVSQTANIANTVTTTGNQTYSGIVTLDGGDIVFNSAAGKLIHFSDKLTGNSNDVTISNASSQFDGEITLIKNLNTANAIINKSVTGIGIGNLTISGNADINSAINGFIDLSISGTSNISANITTTGNQTYSSKVTLDGGNIVFTSTTGKLILFNNAVTGNTNNLSISTAKSQFDGTISNIKDLTTDDNVIYNGTVSITGNLLSKGKTTINSSAISSSGSQNYKSDLTITSNTKLSASNFTSNIINSQNNTEIIATTINFINDSYFTSANLTITNSGLFKTAENKSITCNIFVQNGTGKNMLGGDLNTTTGSWTSDLYIYGGYDSQISGNQTLESNLILAKTSSAQNITINSAISTKNLALYSGTTLLNDNLTTSEDAVLLGPAYNTTDSITGTLNAYKYEQVRYSGSSTGKSNSYTIETTLPNSAAIPTKQGILNIAANKKLITGTNFYANGISITGDIQITDNTDSTLSFAEAYNCTITDSQVTATSGTGKISCEDCTFNGTTTNWNSDPFFITQAYTVRDNVIYIEFNRNVRNKNGELLKAIENQFFSLSNNHKYIGAYTEPDCLDENKLENNQEQKSFYLKSEVSWNTDATGDNSGRTLSTDRLGAHKTETPFIDIVRNIFINDTSHNWIITDIFGKRLENYSTHTLTAGVPYGSNGDTSHGAFDTANHKVEDKTGPVLYSVRTGQELHNIPDGTAESQHSYDSHNFIEFRYSEATNFGSQTATISDIWIPAFTATNAVNTEENVKVSNYFGVLTASEDNLEKTGELNFKGLGTIQNGKIHTGKAGSTDKYVNALYRKDIYSICISIAGYTEGTVTDPYDNHFKKWIGYIESAEMPTGTVTMNFTSAGTNKNPLVSDILGNFQEKYIDLALNTTPIVDCNLDGTPLSLDGLYGTWDTSEPVFAPLRMSTKTLENENNWNSNLLAGKYQSEAIGNTSGTGSTLDRIEFHLFDNTPDFQNSDAEWVSEIGWCNPDSDGKKSDLYREFSYSADIFGGSRVFENDTSRRTSGGIRYSTVYNQSSAFKYINSINEDPTLSFSSTTPTYSGANGLIFSGTSSPRRSALDLDGLYIGLALPSSNYNIKETFTVSYDSTNSYITDLAGNRLRSKIFTTIDRTPPSFDISLSPINQDELYITFVKKLVTTSESLTYIDNNTGDAKNVSTTGSFESIIPSCFKLISIDENGKPVDSTSIKIDTTRPAVIMDKSNNNFTCIKLYLTQNVTLKDIENLYISVISHPDYDEYSQDPFTSHKDSRVTFIQDSNKNYMEMYTAHALSDFAINTINPLYAYDQDMSAEDDQIMYGLYEDGSWAVHDWTEDQKNYGTLPANHPIGLVASTDDGTSSKDNLPVNVRIYLSNNPDEKSVSKQYNNDLEENLRIWLPNATEKVFNSLAESNNTNYSYVDSLSLDEKNPSKGILFDIPKEITSTWNSGDQVSFLFGLFDKDNNPVDIIHSPELDLDSSEIRYLTTSSKFPLYALRLKSETDITSIDLWSFKIKAITEQRGGVSILNNVINNTNGEKTIVKVNLPEAEKLNVIVMTLDGNVITYLNRSFTSAGEHYYSWDGKNKNGKPVARGMYFIRITSKSIDETRKVMVVK